MREAAGYSGTPLFKKLGIRPGMSVVMLHPPRSWSIADLPVDVVVKKKMSTKPDLVLAFFRQRSELVQLRELSEAIFPASVLWATWPRKASGHVSDMDENIIRDTALPLGLVDVKVAAIDHDWSGLKLVWRKELRTSVTA